MKDEGSLVIHTPSGAPTQRAYAIWAPVGPGLTLKGTLAWGLAYPVSYGVDGSHLLDVRPFFDDAWIVEYLPEGLFIKLWTWSTNGHWVRCD
jgi:hypothetical protein